VFVAVQRISQDQPASAREVWLLREVLPADNLKDLFRQRMRGSLDRNPIGWLHIRSVTGRLTCGSGWVW